MIMESRKEIVIFSVKDLSNPDGYNDYYIPYNRVELDESEYQTLQVELENDESYDSFTNYHQTGKTADNCDYEYELSQAEIDEKINQSENLTSEQKEKLKNLITEYKQVFEKKPGLLTIYEHELNNER